MRRTAFAAGLALAAIASLSAVANAGETAPISALATLPAVTPLRGGAKVAGLTLKTSGIGRNKETKWHDLTASPGFCISDPETNARWSITMGASERSPAQDLDVNHLVDKDGKTTLERTRVHFDPASATFTATARTHVELSEVARNPSGVVVFAYREGTSITLLARNASSGTESRTLADDASFVGFVSSDGCAFSGVRIDARKPEAGAIAQMAIVVPPPKGERTPSSRFVVDASLSKVTRDPEPKLAVRIRANP